MTTPHHGYISDITLRDVLRAVPDGMTDNGLRFWEVVTLTHPWQVRSTRAVVALLGWHYSTTVSRFQRAGVPSAKAALTAVHLSYAFAAFEHLGSVVGVSDYLGWPCQQSFGRHVKRETGMTAAEYLRSLDWTTARRLMVEAVVAPFAQAWHTFDPVPSFTRTLEAVIA